MPRCLVILTLLLAAVLGPGSGAAHTMDVRAVLSLEEGRLSVQLLDPYGAAVAGGQVSVVLRSEGSRRTIRVALQEETPGTYVGALDLAGGGRVDLQVDAQLGADLYRLRVQGLPGGNWPEQTWPMVMVEARTFPWGAVVYGLGLAVLGVAATVALVRRAPPAGQEGPDR